MKEHKAGITWDPSRSPKQASVAVASYKKEREIGIKAREVNVLRITQIFMLSMKENVSMITLTPLWMMVSMLGGKRVQDSSQGDGEKSENIRTILF